MIGGVSEQPAKPRGNQPWYDWAAIKARYVEGIPPHGDVEAHTWPTMTEVAEHFGLPNPQRVREIAARDKWTDQRSQYQALLEQTRRAESAKRMAEAATQLDERALDSSRLGIGILAARLREIGINQQARDAGGTGRQVDAREVEVISRALDTFHRVGLRAVGEVESTTSVQHTGPGGVPLTVELTRDDPARLADVFAVLRSAGVPEILDGEVLDDEPGEGSDEGEDDRPALGDAEGPRPQARSALL